MIDADLKGPTSKGGAPRKGGYREERERRKGMEREGEEGRK